MDLLPVPVSPLGQLPLPIPRDQIFVSGGVIRSMTKTQLFDVIKGLDFSQVTFQQGESYELALIEETLCDTIWLVKLCLAGRITYGLVLGTEL